MKPRSKAAVITGDSAGIGFGCARIFGKHGSKVVIGSRGQEAHRAAEKQLTGKLGPLRRCPPAASKLRGRRRPVNCVVRDEVKAHERGARRQGWIPLMAFRLSPSPSQGRLRGIKGRGIVAAARLGQPLPKLDTESFLRLASGLHSVVCQFDKATPREAVLGAWWGFRSPLPSSLSPAVRAHTGRHRPGPRRPLPPPNPK